MFVTVLYAVLDPGTGTLTYANGGHIPARLFRSDGMQVLAPTGMALGMVSDVNWETRTVSLSPGDTLLLYTDGALDAQAVDDGAFGLERLLSTAQAQLGRPCAEIQAAILDELHRFVGSTPRYDDVTLIVIART
jgi:sigma-B regulation protein RsbU (phosphoserine phosphatase)